MESKGDHINDEELSKLRFEFYNDLLKDQFKAKIYLSARLDIIYFALFIVNITFYSRLDEPDFNNTLGIILSISAILLHVIDLIISVVMQSDVVAGLDNEIRQALTNKEEFKEVGLTYYKVVTYKGWNLISRILSGVLLFISMFLIAI